MSSHLLNGQVLGGFLILIICAGCGMQQEGPPYAPEEALGTFELAGQMQPGEVSTPPKAAVDTTPWIYGSVPPEPGAGG